MPSLSAAIGMAPAVGDISGNVDGGVTGSMVELTYLPIFQAGGFDCAWESTGGASYTSVSVVLLPGGAGGLSRVPPDVNQPSATGWGGEARVGCFNQEGFNCRYDVLVGRTWLDVATYTTGDTAAFPAASEALSRDILAAVRAAGDPTPLWIAPTSTLPVDCAALGSYGTQEPDLLTPLQPIQAEAMRLVGAYQCAWLASDGHGSVQAFVMPGGAWAWSVHPAKSNQSITLSPLAGLGDGASGGCSSIIPDCVVHTIAHGGWLGLEVSSTGATVSTAAATAKQMLSLG